MRPAECSQYHEQALGRRVVTRAGSARPFPAGSVPVRVSMDESGVCSPLPLLPRHCRLQRGGAGGVGVSVGGSWGARSLWAAKKRPEEKQAHRQSKAGGRWGTRVRGDAPGEAAVVMAVVPWWGVGTREETARGVMETTNKRNVPQVAPHYRSNVARAW